MCSDPDEGVEMKKCPYCLGEVSSNAVKCKYCGEWLDRKKRRLIDTLERETKETGKSIPKQIIREKINDTRAKGKSKTAHNNGISKTNSIKKWWAAQSAGIKASLILCVCAVAFMGTYLVLASGSDLSINPVENISSPLTPSQDKDISSTTGKNTPSPDDTVRCTACEGTGLVACANCNGTGQITCPTCGGTGKHRYYRANLDVANTCSTPSNPHDLICEPCNGTGKIACTACNGKGKTQCKYCGGDGITGN